MNVLLKLPKKDVIPVQAKTNSKVLCDLQKINNQGRFLYYYYACRMTDPYHVITTFTNKINNHSLSLQIIIQTQLIKEFSKTVQINNKQYFDILYAEDTHNMQIDLSQIIDAVQKRMTSPVLFTFRIFKNPNQKNSTFFSFILDDINNIINSHHLKDLLLPEGTLILHANKLYNRNTQTILWQLYNLFHEVHIIKPDISPRYSSDKYIVCLGFNSTEKKEISVLPPIEWYSYITGIQNEFTKIKNAAELKALELTQMIIAKNPYATEEVLRKLCDACLTDKGIRRFGTKYCMKHNLSIC